MKKVKILLLAIGVVAVTGGLVAFKTLTPQILCTTNAVQTEVDGLYTCKDVQGVTLTCDDLVITAISETVTHNEINGNVFCITEPVIIVVGGEAILTCLGDPCVQKEYQTIIE